MAEREAGYITRGVVFHADVAPYQEALLRSYCGSVRFAYNWAIRRVKENLSARDAEREAGIPPDQMTPAISWSAYSLNKEWNRTKDEVAPWWREVSMHAFRSGINAAAEALKNFSDSKKGKRRGRPVGFPKYKRRGRSKMTVSFVELNHQLSWLHPSRHAVRLMLPQATPDKAVRRHREGLTWIHTGSSTRRLYNLVDQGRARIQKVTLSYTGGRWQVAFSVRYFEKLTSRPRKLLGDVVGVDGGLKHLATLSVPVPGVSDEQGHVANPRLLEAQLRRLARLNRAIARCAQARKDKSKPGERYAQKSKTHLKLERQRARLFGRISKTRALHLHALTNALSGSFSAVVIEDLNLVGMASKKRRLGRSVHDAGLGELRRQLAYKCEDRGSALILVDRYFASSKRCSECEVVKATLPLSERLFECESCGYVADRDSNAARNIEQEGRRLLLLEEATGVVLTAANSDAHDEASTVAELQPETLNAAPRACQTARAKARAALLVRR